MTKNITSLLVAKAGVLLLVVEITTDTNVQQRLNSLGIIKGSTIKLLERRGDLVSVRCLESKYALGSSVTKNIMVSEIQNQGDKTDQRNQYNIQKPQSNNFEIE